MLCPLARLPNVYSKARVGLDASSLVNKVDKCHSYGTKAGNVQLKWPLRRPQLWLKVKIEVETMAIPQIYKCGVCHFIIT